ncbi:MAG: caspase family protein [Candidatus Kariarchaeaceae archaeon]
MKKLILIIVLLGSVVIFGQTTTKSKSIILRPVRTPEISQIISFTNPDIKDNVIIKLSDNEIELSGIINKVNIIKSLFINDTTIVIGDNLSFSKNIHLNEGENKIRIKIVSENGIAQEISFKVISELSTPIITLGNLNINEKNEVINEGDSVLISGEISDVYGIAQLKINDVIVNSIDSKFSQNVYLPLSENFITIEAINLKGKSEIIKLKVINNAFGSREIRTDYALLFATDIYDSFPNLVNPIFDAETIKGELTENYNFETHLVKNAARDSLLATLRKYSSINYDKEDQLMIFFAGHGIFDDIYKEGYLMAADTKNDDIVKSSYLSHSLLQTIVNNIPCEHILLVIDACFSGTFDQRIASRGNNETDRINEEWIEKKLSLKTRKYITSGGKEYVSDGKKGHHSPFARRILQALRDYGGSDGVLTLSELLANLEGIDPEPRSSEFGDNQPGSSFLFIYK